VKVVEGELRNLLGVVESVEDDTVTVMPKHQDLKDLLSFPASQLQKHFKVGDHVKAIAGRFEGDAGLVLRVEENVAIVLSDLSSKEVSAFRSGLFCIG
jgi:transcription elongation factor SPT5